MNIIIKETSLCLEIWFYFALVAHLNTDQSLYQELGNHMLLELATEITEVKTWILLGLEFSLVATLEQAKGPGFDPQY